MHEIWWDLRLHDPNSASRWPGVTIKGMMVSIQGQMQVEMKGAMASVNADGILTLKGSMTMIN